MKDSEKYQVYSILNSKGCFWSYAQKNQIPDDESLIEKALIYLDFEDMHLLFAAFNVRRIKKVWRNNLVSQNQYYSVLNFLLAVFVFKVKNPQGYIKRYSI